jgi:7-keto-8-aminopelargonate synthetase and related enzymes
MQRLKADIERLKSESRYRSLRLPRGIDFTSNDYLGLSTHPALRQAVYDALAAGTAAGSAASRLLRGHHPEHVALEEFAAAFFGAERALYFSTGFLANFALFTTLPHRRDAVVFDELVHASVKEGVHAGHAQRYKVRHNDVEAFDRAIRRARKAGAHDVWIAVESVYSMDGDQAPIAELSALATQHEAMLVVDEAHGSGVFGATGRGLSEGLYDERLIVLHTCGKALGVSGGLLCAPATIIEYMVNAARPFIYSTAPPPYVAAAVHRALQLVDEEPWRRQRLHDLIRLTHLRLAPWRSDAASSPTQILPVILGAEDTTLRTASALQEAGFDVRAIRPPTVPPGTSRLRISLGVDRTEDEINQLAEALGTLMPMAAK